MQSNTINHENYSQDLTKVKGSYTQKGKMKLVFLVLKSFLFSNAYDVFQEGSNIYFCQTRWILISDTRSNWNPKKNITGKKSVKRIVKLRKRYTSIIVIMTNSFVPCWRNVAQPYWNLLRIWLILIVSWTQFSFLNGVCFSHGMGF